MSVLLSVLFGRRVLGPDGTSFTMN